MPRAVLASHTPAVTNLSLRHAELQDELDDLLAMATTAAEMDEHNDTVAEPYDIMSDVREVQAEMARIEAIWASRATDYGAA